MIINLPSNASMHIYPNNTLQNYKTEVAITEEFIGNWEIGLHTDPHSINNIEKIKQEKEKLESIVKKSIVGNRVHFLKYNQELPIKLKELGFLYESSLRHSKDKIDESEMGFSYIDEIIE